MLPTKPPPEQRYFVRSRTLGYYAYTLRPDLPPLVEGAKLTRRYGVEEVLFFKDVKLIHRRLHLREAESIVETLREKGFKYLSIIPCPQPKSKKA